MSINEIASLALVGLAVAAAFLWDAHQMLHAARQELKWQRRDIIDGQRELAYERTEHNLTRSRYRDARARERSAVVHAQAAEAAFLDMTNQRDRARNRLARVFPTGDDR